MTSETELSAALRERLVEALQDAAREPSGEVYARPGALADWLWERLLQPALADRDRLAAELAEAKRDADLGWKAAQDQQDQIEEWAATCKRLMEHNEQLTARLHLRRGECGAVATTGTEFLGRCTIGPHHPSFPHKDPGGTRWQILVLPADTEPDDLTRRLAAAYEQRFDNDGHPEDSAAAVEIAMAVFGPELDGLKGKLAATVRVRDDAIGALDNMQFDRDRLAATVDRVRAECDAIVAEVYGQHDEDDDGMREAVRRIRAALDGTGEA